MMLFLIQLNCQHLSHLCYISQDDFAKALHYINILQILRNMEDELLFHHYFPNITHHITYSPYARALFLRKFINSFIDAIFAATNNLYLIAK